MTAFLLALLLQAPAPVVEEPPVALVRAFLTTVERDPAAAQAMLADDATMVAGDVGGPLDAATFAAMMREFRGLCRLTGLARDPAPFEMPGRAIVVVAGTYHCVSPERPGGHDVQFSYLVENGRLAGVFMGTGAGPRDAERP